MSYDNRCRGRGDRGFNDAAGQVVKMRKRLAAQKCQSGTQCPRIAGADGLRKISTAADGESWALGFLISDAVIAVAPHYPGPNSF